MVLDEHGLPHCLGYCGRVEEKSITSNETWSSCRACPWGTRASSESHCLPCENALPAYDWMYLLFIALLPLLMQIQFIRNARKYCRRRSYEVTEHICVLTENVIAILVSILIYPPRFTFFLNSCDKSTMREWYPVFHNPKIGHSKTLKCSSEIVFPLYSLPFVHHLVLITTILIFRSILYCVFLHKTYNGKPFYNSLISLPLLAGLHAFFAGVLYYTFPWILLTTSTMVLVYHVSRQGKMSILELIVRLVTSPLHLTFLLIVLLLLTFSFTAIIIPLSIEHRWLFLCLVPVPITLYLIILPFTHPTQISKYQ